MCPVGQADRRRGSIAEMVALQREALCHRGWLWRCHTLNPQLFPISVTKRTYRPVSGSNTGGPPPHADTFGGL